MGTFCEHGGLHPCVCGSQFLRVHTTFFQVATTDNNCSVSLPQIPFVHLYYGKCGCPYQHQYGQYYYQANACLLPSFIEDREKLTHCISNYCTNQIVIVPHYFAECIFWYNILSLPKRRPNATIRQQNVYV